MAFEINCQAASGDGRRRAPARGGGSTWRQRILCLSSVTYGPNFVQAVTLVAVQRPTFYSPAFEALEDRRMLAVTASFSAASGVLNVYGDSGDNTIEVSRNAAGGDSRERRSGGDCRRRAHGGEYRADESVRPQRQRCALAQRNERRVAEGESLRRRRARRDFRRFRRRLGVRAVGQRHDPRPRRRRHAVRRFEQRHAHRRRRRRSGVRPERQPIA